MYLPAHSIREGLEELRQKGFMKIYLCSTKSGLNSNLLSSNKERAKFGFYYEIPRQASNKVSEDRDRGKTMSGMVRQMKEGMELLIKKEVFSSRISLAFSRLSVFINMLSLFCFQVKTCS